MQNQFFPNNTYTILYNTYTIPTHIHHFQYKNDDQCYTPVPIVMTPRFRLFSTESQFCPSPDGKFPAGQCRSYYHCKQGVPTMKHCLHGTRFYAPDQRCILGSC